jgi:hypothetical protein
MNRLGKQAQIRSALPISSGCEPAIAWRHASAADVTAYFGAPREETIRGVVITLDGKPAGIICMVWDPACWTLQSEYKPELVPYLRRFPVLRAIAHVMGWVRNSSKPVLAIREPDSDVLVRLGFDQIRGDVFCWPDHTAHLQLDDLERG